METKFYSPLYRFPFHTGSYFSPVLHSSVDALHVFKYKDLYRGANKSLARQFSSDAEVTAAAETWLDGQPSDFLF